MNNSFYVDANIFIDALDTNREHSSQSSASLKYIVNEGYEVYTSCDLITTIYYVQSRVDRDKALKQVCDINNICNVVEFSNREIEKACQLMLEDRDYKDLEDTIQYVLAKKMECNVIVSNDKNFVAKEMNVLTSQEFLTRYVNHGEIK